MERAKGIAWEAPEFEYRSKGVSWYWLTIIIAVFFVALAVWQRNFLFGVFVVIAEVLVLSWGNRTPTTLSFRADDAGFAVGKEARYAWSEFASFSFGGEGGLAALALRFRHRLRPALRVLVPAAHAAAVREVFAAKLPEVEHTHSLAETLEELLRF